MKSEVKMCDCESERHRTVPHSPLNFTDSTNYHMNANARYTVDHTLRQDNVTFCRCNLRQCSSLTSRRSRTHRRKTVCQLEKLMQLFPSQRFFVSYTLRFCLKGFIVWTFLVAPILSHILQHTPLLGKKTLVVGTMPVKACHPGHPGTHNPRRRPLDNPLVPFKLRQYVPKMSELTIGASGPAEGPIGREELETNWNPDIVFKDEEQNNEDRMMTDRCRKSLDALAIFVLNYWPGVKLRVTEAWDSEGRHGKNSLHYEGRAVDITTSDLDRSKYPMLARLAVEAGFDWVYYERKDLIHCSVKSDNSDAARYGGCFPGDTIVPVPGGGTKRMSDLYPGDEVFAVDGQGNVVVDTLLTFMDLQKGITPTGSRLSREFVSIRTRKGSTLRLTANHLVYVTQAKQQNQPKRHEALPDFSTATAIFSGRVEVGQFIYVLPNNSKPGQPSSDIVLPEEVVSVKRLVSSTGAYAPLTQHGTIIVDNVVASCYAVVESDVLGHLVISPVRFYHYVRHSWLFKTLFFDAPRSQEQGISVYSKLLYNFASRVLPESKFRGA